MKMRKEFFEKPACPINCEYCMVTRIEGRSSKWKRQHVYGINKTLLFINRLPGENLKYNKRFVCSEFVGFEGISDPFWKEYRHDLFSFLKETWTEKAKKVILVTKWNLDENLVQRVAKHKHLVVAVSVTGLDGYKIEKTSTKKRIKSIELLKKHGIPTIALIHPYIHGLSDLSFLKDLRSIGEGEVSVKGFRFNADSMPKIASLLKEKSYFENQEEEILAGEEYVKENLARNGLKNVPFREWAHRPNRQSVLDNYMADEEAESIARELLQICTVSSSEKDFEELKKIVIQRRLKTASTELRVL